MRDLILRVTYIYVFVHVDSFQNVPISIPKRYIVYICICVLRFSWNHDIFYYIYIFKMGNRIKEEEGRF